MLKGDNCLYYYKHSKDKVPCGVIILCNYSITKAPEYSRKSCFKLNKGGARSYHFCASNDNEMREWMVALMAAASEIAPDGVGVVFVKFSMSTAISGQEVNKSFVSLTSLSQGCSQGARHCVCRFFGWPCSKILPPQP